MSKSGNEKESPRSKGEEVPLRGRQTKSDKAGKAQ